MSEAAEPEPDPGDAAETEGAAGGGNEAGFELPRTDQAELEGRKLRRRLFGGFRAGDVREELRSRNEEIAELRRDVAALWLAFGQHERAIRELIIAVEASGGPGIDPPGGRTDSGGGERRMGPEPSPEDEPAEAAAGGEPAGGAGIGEQLGDLDQILAAIEEATRSLERTYQEQIASEQESAAGEAADEPEPDAQEPEPDGDADPGRD